MPDYIKKNHFNPMPPKTERNAAIVKSYEQEGLSYTQLAIIYGITPQRCQQIIKAYGTKKVKEEEKSNAN